MLIISLGNKIECNPDIFVQELLTLDSHENITYQKEKRLKKLIEEAERLRALDIEKETINQEYTTLQQTFITKQKQVRVVEDYISKIHDMIDNNISRRNFAESYLNFMRFENEVKKLIEERQTTMSKLEDNDPSKGAFQLEIDGLERQYEENKMKIDELIQNPENERVLKALTKKRYITYSSINIFNTTSCVCLLDFGTRYGIIIWLGEEGL